MTHYLVYADGASRGNPGPASYGFVVYELTWPADTLVHSTGDVIGQATCNVAEYQGLIAALTYVASREDVSSVEVRMDSKLVIEQMQGHWKVNSPALADLCKAAREIVPMERVILTWVPREQNSEADQLANMALNAGGKV